MQNKITEIIPLNGDTFLMKTVRNVGEIATNNITVEIEGKIFNIGSYTTNSDVAQETFFYNERAIAIVYIRKSDIFVSSLFDIQDRKFIDSSSVDMLRRFNGYFREQKKVYTK